MPRLSTAVCASLVLLLGACGPKTTVPVTNETPPTPLTQGPSVSGLFHLEQDARRCAAPLCGGWWITSVSGETLACPSGPAARCYAAKGEADQEDTLVHGAVVQATLWPADGELANLKVHKSWQPIGPGAIAPVTLLSDNGVRCITAPCPSISATLVGGETTDVTDVDVNAIGKHDPQDVGEALMSGTLLGAGSVEERDGAQVFVAAELWLP